jgi:hypothetical protein
MVQFVDLRMYYAQTFFTFWTILVIVVFSATIPVKKTELTTGGIRRADHATPSIRKSWH